VNGRLLIVNADDFGRSDAINGGIVQAHERGIVTSASLMVRWEAAGDATAYAREHGELSLGLHLDLGEWEVRNGEWTLLYERASTGDPAAVGAELRSQLEAFRALAGRDPTHLDSHQHVHREQPVAAIARDMARTLGVPLRDCSGIPYRGDFYGQTRTGDPYPEGITFDGLVRVLRELPDGISELGCHPGFGANDQPYGREREQEVRVLCDPRLRDVLDDENIRLVSFEDPRIRSLLSRLPAGMADGPAR
jgi:predicted glycoside hydrolase/deacetylase ChbG (UPF0249 family)